MKNVIVKTQALKKYYQTGNQTVRALDGVNFEVAEREFVSIVGKSGSGKSTLLHMIGGLDTPSSGTVIVDGLNLETLNSEQLALFRRRKVGFIFQQYNLIPDLNVYDNITFPLELDGTQIDKDFIQELLETLNISDKQEMLPAMLSGGEQQRVAIIRALATKPAIILADEPTGNLDTSTSHDVIGLLKMLSRQAFYDETGYDLKNNGILCIKLNCNYVFPTTIQSIEKSLDFSDRQIFAPTGYIENSFKLLLGISQFENMRTIQESQGEMMEIGTIIALLLLLVGVLNYTNTIASSIQNRKLTFSVMESIGMSKKQINQLLIREGVLYALFSVFITLTIGSVITYICFESMNYMEIPFNVPVFPLFSAIILVMLICMITPLLSYKKLAGNRSIVERLRDYEY